MKLSTYTYLLLSAVYVSAAPAPEAAPKAAADSVLPDSLEARDLTRGQCKAACDKGADGVEAFCRRVPDIRIRALCWGVATAVQTPAGQAACTAFCDAWF